MRMIRLIIILYGVCNLIVTIVKMGTIVIININIKDMLVIIIPLGVIVILNTPRQSSRDYNRDIESRKWVKINGNEKGIRRDDRGNRVRVIKRVGR